MNLVADDNGGSPTLAIEIPSNCIRISITTLLTTCTMTIDPQTVVGSYNNAANQATFGPLVVPLASAGACWGITSPTTWAQTGSGNPVVYTASPSIQINP